MLETTLSPFNKRKLKQKRSKVIFPRSMKLVSCDSMYLIKKKVLKHIVLKNNFFHLSPVYILVPVIFSQCHIK